MKFVKCALVSPSILLGDSLNNAKKIVEIIKNDEFNSVMVFPELTITGYSMNDLFFNSDVRNSALEALEYIVTNNDDHLVILGSILEFRNKLYNVAYVIKGNEILGVVPKMNLSDYAELKESRYFSNFEYEDTIMIEVLRWRVPFGNLIFNELDNNLSFGVEIGEDLWANNSPHEEMYNEGAQIVFNVASDAFCVGKEEERKVLIQSASLKGNGAYLYVSTGGSETSSDLVYSGTHAASVLGSLTYYSEVPYIGTIISYVDIDLEAINNQKLLKKNINSLNELLEVKFSYTQNFIKLHTTPSKLPYDLDLENAAKVSDATVTAIIRRLNQAHAEDVVLGVSGGLDSTVALLFLITAFKRAHIALSKIHAISIPALATSTKTISKINRLVKPFEIDFKEIDVKEEVLNHLDLIGHDQVTKDITYENAQARYRTYVLMDLANLHKGIVIGTGDMSEIALGWCTFNGDHMSMYNVNAGLPKTAIKAMVRYFKTIYPEINEVLDEILNAPISPELTDNSQDTEEAVGKYEVNDFILNQILEFGASKEKIMILLSELFELDEQTANLYYNKFMRRFKTQQFKRLSAPEGIKIFKTSLSARSSLYISGDIN